jgi:hypothetical protein
MKTVVGISTILILNTLSHSSAWCQSISGVVNSYYNVSGVNVATNVVTVGNAAGLSAGQVVLLIQMKGASINSANTANYGDISAIGDAGNYEFNSICTVNGNQVWLQNKMVNAYDPTGEVQLITVPSYASLVISGTVTAKPWDTITGTGGVVVLAASNSITLNSNIDVSGQGFLGGALVNYPVPPYNCDFITPVTGYEYGTPASGYYTGGTKGEGVADYLSNQQNGRGKLSNGGGGGNNANAGGAGGANYGLGGAGGKRAGESNFDCHAQYPGIGGASLSGYGYTPGANRIFMGGGGGSGQENNAAGEPGANGGGIMILSTPAIIGNGGQLLANGLQPTNPVNTDPLQAEGDGGGGGGAGGAIIINSTTISGAITAQANGGQGSNSSNFVNDCTGPGGGGGGGVVWVAGAAMAAGITATETGGVNGVVSSGNTKVACKGLANGATSGATGLSQTGYLPVVANVSVCVALASPALEYFTGTRSDGGVVLTWALSSSAPVIRDFVLQRATDSSGFVMLATIAGSPDSPRYSYTDNLAGVEGSVSYRLTWQDATGAWSYSRILHLTVTQGPDGGSLALQPNPATDQLTVSVYSWTGEAAAIKICDVLGRPMSSMPVSLRQGMNSVVVPLAKLAPAIYFLVLETEGRRQVKGFVKR